MGNYLSLAEVRRRLGLDIESTAALLAELTPQQRNALCELRSRARLEAKFSAWPLLRACDVEAWVAERFDR